MELLFVAIIFLVNLGISFWNAKVAGWAWVETKHAGGWPRFMTWMAAAMSAIGFTWCYLIVFGFGAIAFDALTVEEAEVFFALGYIILVPGVLFAGTMIMIDSWARAYRERTLANFGVAGYNTFANMYNYYHAIKDTPKAVDTVLDAFKGGDDSKNALILLLVILALASGIITTWVIIDRTAASDDPMPNLRTA